MRAEMLLEGLLQLLHLLGARAPCWRQIKL